MKALQECKACKVLSISAGRGKALFFVVLRGRKSCFLWTGWGALCNIKQSANSKLLGQYQNPFSTCLNIQLIQWKRTLHETDSEATFSGLKANIQKTGFLGRDRPDAISSNVILYPFFYPQSKRVKRPGFWGEAVPFLFVLLLKLCEKNIFV